VRPLGILPPRPPPRPPGVPGGRGFMMRSLPPSILSAVAVS
jgi:hypothetical protein